VIKAVRGMHDLVGTTAAQWQKVESRVRALLEAFGYSEIRTPVLEHIEVFTQAVGEGTDIVEKQMYTVADRNSADGAKPETLVLRPEATSSVIRAVLENQLHRAPHPQRFYYILPMFRYERPQKGRLRQFHQIGAELMGDATPEADAEAIVLLDAVFRSFGLTEYEIRINSVGSSACRPAYKEKLKGYFQPHLAALCADCQKRFDRAPMRILDCKVEGCRALAEKAPRVVDHLDPESTLHFQMVQKRLTQAGVPFVLDPGIVRGLDYYSRTAFEFTSSLLGAQSALGGGGRYDELTSRFGEDPYPAVGWALGLERLMMALEAKDLLKFPVRKPNFFFAPLGDGAFEALYALALRLKRAGIWVEMSHEQGKKAKWLMKQADRSGAEYTLILGEDELVANQALIKNMTTGEQTPVPWKTIEEDLKRRASEQA
jgi:histidyl-tRNA synthetase